MNFLARLSHPSERSALLLGLFVAACEPSPIPTRAPEPKSQEPTLRPTSLAESAPPSSAVQSAAAPTAFARTVPSRDSPFVRRPSHSSNSDADGVDECLQTGGNYFSCSSAILAAEEAGDAVLRRYLWRIARAHGAGESTYRNTPQQSDDIPHAEAPNSCDPSKPCGARTDGGELNRAMFCLAQTLVAPSPAHARAAHAKACECDPIGGALPGYNATPFICDARGKPAFIAPEMKQEEANLILDCARCHPRRGATACEAEITRLQPRDPELATFVDTKQIPRCQTANDGPRSWSETD